MNLLGKIFVVLILIMSVVFMTAAMAVYATHKNWQKAYETANASFNDARSEKSRLVIQRDDLEKRLQAEKNRLLQDLSTLETQRDQLEKANQQLQATDDELQRAKRSAIAASEATQTNNTQLSKENDKLRLEVRKEQEERDVAFASANKALDGFHNKLGELSKVTEGRDVLLRQVAEYRAYLQSKGITNGIPPATIPIVEGQVLVVQRNNSDTLIEISLGTDDALAKGHTVQIYRGQKYLGRATITETYPDRAIGRVSKRYNTGTIEVNDHVATKLRS